MKKCLSLLGTLVLAAACTDAGPPSLIVSAEEMLSPAGIQSGEPFVSSSADGVYLSWLEAAGDGHELRVSRLGEDGWGEPSVVAARDDFFVNWADFPSVSPALDGTLWAHWLQRGPNGGYDYGVRIAHSSDDGATWSDPWTPHEDGSPTEHGFVSVMPLGNSMGFAWLDGRQFAPAADGTPGSEEMTLRFPEINAHGNPGAETLLDAKICDCCQTDAAVTSVGPVVVYRDRTDAEIRDIYITRMVDGAWTPGTAVHDDGWEIGGCPVNGPAVAVAGDMLAVAWFTGADNTPRVKVAFSADNGASFGEPTIIDDGGPSGRVDMLGLPGGDVLVTWLERTEGDGAEVRMRRVRPDGAASEAATLAASSAGRPSGFPRLGSAPDGTFVMAWTDVSELPARVRVTRLEVER